MAEKKNIKVLRQFIGPKGKPVMKGEVIAKSDFPSNGEWRNLAHMKPPKVVETDEAVGKAKAAAKAP